MERSFFFIIHVDDYIALELRNVKQFRIRCKNRPFGAEYLSKLLLYTSGRRVRHARAETGCTCRGTLPYACPRQNASRAIFLDPFHIPYTRENTATAGMCQGLVRKSVLIVNRNTESDKTSRASFHRSSAKGQSCVLSFVLSSILYWVCFLAATIVSQFPAAAIGSHWLTKISYRYPAPQSRCAITRERNEGLERGLWHLDDRKIIRE